MRFRFDLSCLGVVFGSTIARPVRRLLARLLVGLGVLGMWSPLLQAQTTTLAAGRVYVSSEKDNNIQVFDLQGARIGAIEVCKRPRHMMFSPNRRQIYVCCGDSNQLGLVDVATQKMTGVVPLGDSPEIFGLSPDGAVVYVSIEDDNVMAAYDLKSKAKLFDVKTGGEPEGILVTPDGKRVYVTSEVANLFMW